MSPNDPLPPDLEEIESLLGQLTPRACTVGPASLTEQAEQGTDSPTLLRGPFLWQCATAALFLLCLGLGYQLAQKPKVQVVYKDRLVTPPVEEQKQPIIVQNQETKPEQSPAVEPVKLDDYPSLRPESFLRMRQTVFFAGVDALPDSPLPASHPDEQAPAIIHQIREQPDASPRSRWNQLFPLNFGDVL